MVLSVGDRFSRYHVTALLGKGGMGYVYRAVDTHLKREVALKVLPEEFANDTNRQARFEREARVLASLDHPGLAAIYGVEDIGDTRVLVLELVEGQTLADRIAHGPVPIDEALPIARQIAEALEAAHEAGVIHRDLKPANIKIRPNGTVKILDFGLAKAVAESDGDDPPSESPTMTAAGLILGTAAYMSPEQARGRPVDKRTDIWSFGCVLYEMLTGCRPFDGDNPTDVLAAVVLNEPDWSRVPRGLSAQGFRILRRCLEREHRDRLRDIGEARLELRDGVPPVAPGNVVPGGATAGVRRARAIGALGVTVAVLAGLLVWRVSRASVTPRPRVAFTVESPIGVPMLPWILPGADTLVFTGLGDGPAQVFARPYRELEPRAITGTEGRYASGFSPDGRWLLVSEFGRGGRLLRIPVAGGSGTPIAVAHGRTATWGPDDRIVFGSNEGLWLVAASGGEPSQLTFNERDDETHFFPHFLPNGRGVLFEVWTGVRETAQLAVYDFDAGEPSILLPGMSPQYAETGHLVFWRHNALWAVAFDIETLKVSGVPTPVLDGVSANFDGYAHFGIGRDGTLAYVPPDRRAGRRSLVWVDSNGREEPLAADPAPYGSLALSPDARSVALEIQGSDAPSPLIQTEGNTDIWLYGLSDDSMTRLTFDSAEDRWPVWTTDGLRIVFASSRDIDAPNLYVKAANGAGEAMPLATSSNMQHPDSVTPNGEAVVFHSGRRLATVDMEGRVTDLLCADFQCRQGTVSPDGRWIAFVTNESDQSEVYVAPFPNVADARWPVSNGPGVCPVWGPDSRQLFFQSRQDPSSPVKMMRVDIRTEPVFRVGPPTTLFAGPYRFGNAEQCRSFDTRDGERFLVIKEHEPSERARVVVVQDWTDELERLVP